MDPRFATLNTQRLGPGFRAVFWTPAVSLGLFEASGPQGEVWSEDFVANHLHEGGYVRRGSAGREVVDPNRWAFFDLGESYEQLTLAPRRRGSYIRFHPELLAEMLAATGVDRLGFARRTAPVDAQLLKRWHALLAAVRAGGLTHGEALEALLLLGSDLVDATQRAGAPAGGRDVRAAREVQARLAREPAANTSLPALAAEVDLSPFQLARGFRAHTGCSVHQYRDRLRLHQAAARVATGATDLAGLGLELGYSSHSHFTARFRRYFGVPPSRYPSGTTPRARPERPVP